MNFDFSTLPAKQRYNLLISSVMPRPIALTTTVDAQGRVNAAPFSFFNVVSTDPPLVVLGIEVAEPGRPKDTARNIAQTGEFVINLVDESLADAMNVCSIDFPPGVDELSEAGLESAPSVAVKPPRVARAPVSLECRRFQSIDLGGGRGVEIGQVLWFHVRDDLVLDEPRAYLDGAAMHLVGRMHGRVAYTRTRDLFELRRIGREAWAEQSPRRTL